MPEQTCSLCGHPKSSHYTYILNGEEQGRCKECDPFTGLRDGGDFELQAGSREDAADKFADHAYTTTAGGEDG